ncbi:MAG: hypothetical protein AAFQ51_01165, partial [Pseudomonadota bacterium]
PGEDASPVETLRTLADETADRAMRQRLDQIAGRMERAFQERDELRIAALKNLLLSGALITRRINGLYENIEGLRAQFPGLDGPGGLTIQDSDPMIQLARARYTETLVDFYEFTSVYQDTLVNVADTYETEQMRAEARALYGELTGQERTDLAAYLAHFAAQARDTDPSRGWSSREAVVRLLAAMRPDRGEPDWLDTALAARR